MSVSGKCHIVVLLNCREQNKQLQWQGNSFPWKQDEDGMMVRDKCKRQADVILLIATHVNFVQILCHHIYQ